MSFELPDLDTQSAGQIQAQLVRRIPQFTTKWTDFNASDPGITLLQLLSWLGESLAYQANAIPIEAVYDMLRRVLGLPMSSASWPYARAASAQYDAPFLALRDLLAQIERGARPGAAAVQAAILEYLRTPYLAVTLADVEALALQANAMIDARQAEHSATPPPLHVRRADAFVAGEATQLRVLSDAVLSYARPAAGNSDLAAGPWRATLLLQPPAQPGAAQAEAALVTAVESYVAPRVLLGSAVQVRPARLTDIDIVATLTCPAAVQPGIVITAALDALLRYFQPAGPSVAPAKGWRYGEAPSADAVRHLLGGIPGVVAVPAFTLDYAPSLRLGTSRLGVDSLIAALPLGAPAMRYDGLPRLRSVSLVATKVAL